MPRTLPQTLPSKLAQTLVLITLLLTTLLLTTLLLTTLLTSLWACTGTPDVDSFSRESCTIGEQESVYQRYIAPIVTDGTPQSCNQCHLSGIDLNMFVQATPCLSMACLVEKDLVDLADPVGSKILSFIERAQPQSRVITQDVINREYDGFMEWIEWSASCHADVCGVTEDPCNAGTVVVPDDPNDPEDPVDPNDPPIGPGIGSCSEMMLATAFQNNVLKHRKQCETCHDGGDNYSGVEALWLDPQTDYNAAVRSMHNTIGLGLWDTANPSLSKFITKPLDESYAEGLNHEGGNKIDKMSAPYKDFLGWGMMYANCL